MGCVCTGKPPWAQRGVRRLGEEVLRIVEILAELVGIIILVNMTIVIIRSAADVNFETKINILGKIVITIKIDKKK